MFIPCYCHELQSYYLPKVKNIYDRVQHKTIITNITTYTNTYEYTITTTCTTINKYSSGHSETL
jgi:hypothetical protein